jgi:hypothetical protein
MQYAIHRLGFKPEQIVVMGWSIGGYAATWLAMNYPDIKGLVRSCYTVFSFNRSFFPFVFCLLPFLSYSLLHITVPYRVSIQLICLKRCCGSGSESGSGFTGSTCFWASWIRTWIHSSELWIRILLSLSKNSKKTLIFTVL